MWELIKITAADQHGQTGIKWKVSADWRGTPGQKKYHPFDI